jgi:hypothetical protein
VRRYICVRHRGRRCRDGSDRGDCRLPARGMQLRCGQLVDVALGEALWQSGFVCWLYSHCSGLYAFTAAAEPCSHHATECSAFTRAPIALLLQGVVPCANSGEEDHETACSRISPLCITEPPAPPLFLNTQRGNREARNSHCIITLACAASPASDRSNIQTALSPSPKPSF